MLDFLIILGLLAILLGATLGASGTYIFIKHRRNGALFLGTILVLFGLATLYLASIMSAGV